MRQTSFKCSGGCMSERVVVSVFSSAAPPGGCFFVKAAFAGILVLIVSLSAAVADDCSASTEVLARGQAVAAASCKRCHGTEGRGNPDTLQSTQAKVPRLAAQPRNYLAKAMAGYVMGFNWQEDPKSVFFTAGMRVDDTMGMIAASLNKEEVDAVSLWYHCQN